MKKSQLEQARRSFAGGIGTAELRTRVQADLEVVKSAYDLAEQFMTKIEMLLANVEHDDKPAQALRNLAASYKDTAATMVEMRQEARASIAHVRASAQPQVAPQQLTLSSAPAATPAITWDSPEVDVSGAYTSTQVNGRTAVMPASAGSALAEPSDQEPCQRCEYARRDCTCPPEPRVVTL